MFLVSGLLLLLAVQLVEGAQTHNTYNPQKYQVTHKGHDSLAATFLSPARNTNTTGGLIRSQVIEVGAGGVHHQVRKDGAHGNSLVEEMRSKGSLECGWTTYAPEDPCPNECPLLAEESWNPCHFQCVSEDQCGILDPKATVADYDQLRCRSCMVAGCEVCSSSGKDKCRECSLGYILDDLGQCYSAAWYVWAFVKTIGLFVFAGLACWVIELFLRRPTNLKGLKHGMKFRARQRHHMPLDTPEKLGVVDPNDSAGLLYPLTTNTLTTPVGGTGCSLHFSFQVYTIIWGFVLCVSWTWWANTYGFDMLKLGTLPAHTPAQLCSVVRWGAKRQEEMMFDKVGFVIWAYVFQFVSVIAFTAFQQTRFNQMDEETTMKDYVAYVRGLPYKLGEEDVEGLFKDFIEQETGQKTVGISCAWNIMRKDVGPEIESALELDAIAQEKEHLLLKHGGKIPEEEEEAWCEPGALTTAFYPLDNIFLKHAVGLGEGTNVPPQEVNVNAVRVLLEKLKTSDVAFAVFETEEARDKAVEVCKAKRGFMHEGNIVRLEKKCVEPGTVKWNGISLGSRTGTRNRKMIFGACFIPVCLALWSCIFYLPYAYYVTAFSYANGDQPSAFANLVFTMLVVAGNQAMYFIADLITEYADFAFEDERQFWYNVYYLTACILNVAADMVVTAYMSYKMMVSIGVHTAEGTKLESLTRFQDIVESYPMQKTMGSMLYAYAYPGTFLLPFLFEPIGIIYLPYLASKLMLRSHREYQDRDAELAMQIFMPMDLGRYSDLLLNMIIAVLCLYLPGGYILPMFLSMSLSHVYIFCYDHWRVLRFMPKFHYSRNVNDQFGSIWMVLPCALTLSCAVFKGYHAYWPELNGTALACVMLWAFVFHCALHLFIIKMIFKIKPEHKPSKVPYSECAKNQPENWFSVNPVHCLRSKYIWGHEPSQVYYMAGKEHLQRENKEIGSYYEDKKAQQPEEEKTGEKQVSKKRPKPRNIKA